MTLLQIEIMLHYYCRCNDFPDREPPAVRDAFKFLMHQDMIRLALGENFVYRITERGTVYVNALCTMPLPVQKWVQP